jgi:hypothetical protein
MAFTVQDFQDLIRLLAEHPEWRAELRRHVLSDELLELPALVRQLADRLATLTTRVERLEAGLVRLEAAIERLAEAPGRTETRVGRVEGEVLELRYARRAPAYLSRLARRLRVVETGPLADLLDEAVGEQRLTEAEQEAVLAADLILTGRRREDDAEVYLLADISAGIGPHDVERAAERAATLQKLGRPVLPIVAGWRIDAEAVELAGERGVWHALDGQVFPPRGS